MRKYVKPQMEVIELQIAESIAALIPKTIYKSGGVSGSTAGLGFDTKEKTEFKDFEESSII